MYGGATVPAAAEARVVRANTMYGGAHSMVVSQEERKKVAEAWERLQQDGTATGAAQDGWKWGLCPRSVQPKGRVLSVKGSREGWHQQQENTTNSHFSMLTPLPARPPGGTHSHAGRAAEW